MGPLCVDCRLSKRIRHSCIHLLSPILQAMKTKKICNCFHHLSIRKVRYILRCCRLTWGLSLGVLTIIYKVIFLPKLLYGCLVWGSSLIRAWSKKLLRAIQLPFALAISGSFRKISTLSAQIIDNIPPIDYPIKSASVTNYWWTTHFHCLHPR